jgi:hypothetical protein
MSVPRFVVKLALWETLPLLHFLTHLALPVFTFFAATLCLSKAFLRAVTRTANNARETFVAASDLDVAPPFFHAEISCKLLRMTEVALEVGQFRRASLAHNLRLPLASEMYIVPAEALVAPLAAVAFLLSPSLARFAHRLVILLQSVSALAVRPALDIVSSWSGPSGNAQICEVRDAFLAFPCTAWCDAIFVRQVIQVSTLGRMVCRYKGMMNPHVATAIAAHLETQLLSDLEADLHQDHSLNVFLFRVCWRVLSQISTESGAEESQEAVWSRRHAAAKQIGRKGTQQQ